MINTSDFSERLNKIITYYGLSASAFAELIHVQRSKYFACFKWTK